ncbi:MAG: methylmalonyl Co-A mutase-associated GTPase MeaB [Gammaproteobacteria bacterium]|nr:methylmalonyl Co-A mutase-associated GTPase MeaB [Gammaproteobacteria bacterium]
MINADILVDGILQDDPIIKRRSLAKAITLIESEQSNEKPVAEALLKALLPYTGNSLRIGISGAPGVGKSTFIEAFGFYLLSLQHKIAVLAIDPSSHVSGGSILGDKTRMHRLSVEQNAFVRPSPSRGILGGVAISTREVIMLCEAAGYDTIIVESVGVGQSEMSVAKITDILVLLLHPHAGDELQSIKKGLMEYADFFVVNKMDLDAIAAKRAQIEIQNAWSHNSRVHAPPKENVFQVSSLHNQGIEECWQYLSTYFKKLKTSGQLKIKHTEQTLSWLQEFTEAQFMFLFTENKILQKSYQTLTADLVSQKITFREATHCLLQVTIGELMRINSKINQ